MASLEQVLTAAPIMVSGAFLLDILRTPLRALAWGRVGRTVSEFNANGSPGSLAFPTDEMCVAPRSF